MKIEKDIPKILRVPFILRHPIRKAESFISIRSMVMSQILTVFDQVFVNFILRTLFSKISWLMFSTPMFDAKLHSASNNDSFKKNIWQKYGSLGPNTMFSTVSCQDIFFTFSS
jgi:hypothetical protein